MRSRNHRVCTIVLLCGAAVSGGCYTYSSAGIAEVPIGNDVRVQVTAAKADRAEPILGYHSATLEGRLIERHANGEFMLRIPGQAFSSSGRTQRYYQRLTLMPADVLDVETRSLNVRRTAALLAIGVAAVAFIVKSQFNGQTGGSVPGGTGGSPQATILPFH